MVCQLVTRKPYVSIPYRSAVEVIMRTAEQFDGGLDPSGTFPAQESAIKAIHVRTVEAAAACAARDEPRRRMLLTEIAALALSTVAGMGSE